MTRLATHLRKISLRMCLLAFAIAIGGAIGSGALAATLGWERTTADTYRVEPGDTLSGIAIRLKIDISVILALNEQITSPDSIYPGQDLQIPDNAAVPVPSDNADATVSDPATPASGGRSPLAYRIQPGDTLFEIASDFRTDVASIIALNPDIKPNALHIGTQLVIQRDEDESETSDQTPTRASIQTSPTSASKPIDSSDRTSDGGAQALNAGVRTHELGVPATRTVKYVVEPGDYASDIAEHHGVTLDLLRQHNPDVSLDTIHPGQELNIPFPDYRVPALDPADVVHELTDRYNVQTGDNLTKIANNFGLTIGELLQLNPGIDLSSTIHPSQQIIVPWSRMGSDLAAGTVPAVEVRRRMHRVQRDDTFASIAERHGLTLDELRELNPLRPSDLIVLGELLYLHGTIDPPVVAETRTLQEADLVQYAAASLGVTPRTLLANHPWLENDQWLSAETPWRLPLREGLLVTVQGGDTLRALAAAHGVTIDDILADPANGVEDPNAIVIGQEIILPFAMPSFGWPSSGEITDPFGLCRSWDCSYRHNGLDIALDYYEPIVAAADGLVTFVGGDPNLGLGWYVEIEHEHGWATTYAHLVEFEVQQGQLVSRGEVVGYNGNTGYSTGPHLHFEVRHDDWYIDPLVVLP